MDEVARPSESLKCDRMYLENLTAQGVIPFAATFK